MSSKSYQAELASLASGQARTKPDSGDPRREARRVDLEALTGLPQALHKQPTPEHKESLAKLLVEVVMKPAHAEAWLVFLFVLLDASKSFKPRLCGCAWKTVCGSELSRISVARHCRQSCRSSWWTSWKILRLTCTHHSVHDRSTLPHRPDVCALGHCVEECAVNRLAFRSLLACM